MPHHYIQTKHETGKPLPNTGIDAIEEENSAKGGHRQIAKA